MSSSKDSYMIILNDQKSNSNFEKTLKKYTETLNFGVLECPNCHSSDYIRWGTYERGVTYYKNQTIYSETIILQRIRCKSCGKTHALLSFGIVPYKQLTDEVIIDLLNDYNTFLFSDHTILHLKKQFRKYFVSYLSTILKTTSVSTILQKLKSNKNDILLRFITLNGRCFMQIRLGFLSLCPL